MSKKPTRLYLVRHGEVVRQGRGKFLGFTNLGLSRTGEKQVKDLAGHLKNFSIDRVYASDLGRAVDTAKWLCQGRKIAPIPLPGFREMDMGDWDGKSWQEIKKKNHEISPFFFYDLKSFRFPGGETWVHFRKRVLQALEGLLDKNSGKNILLVAHGGVNRIILTQALGLKYKNMFLLGQDYAALNIIDYYEITARVVLMNGIYYAPKGKKLKDG